MTALLHRLAGWLPGTASALARRAARARRAHDLDRAISLAREAERRFPRHPAGSYELGRCLLHMGRAAEASIAFARACEHAPHEPRHLAALGAALHDAGDTVEAERFLDLAVSRGAVESRTWYNRGLVLMAQQKWGPAASSFEEAAALDSRSAMTYSLVGYCRAMSGDAGRSVTAYERVLTLDPNHPRGWYNLGACLYMARRFDAARQAFERALLDDPSDQRAARALDRTRTRP